MPSSSRWMSFLRDAQAGAVFLALCAGSPVFAQEPTGVGSDVDAASIREKLHVSDFHLQSIQIPRAARGAAVSAVIELGGNTVTLQLRPHSVRSADFQLYSRGIGGTLTPLPAPPPRTYRGWIEDVPGSGVAASIIDGQLLGQIADGQSTWWIQPLDKLIPGSDRKLHVTYASADVAPGDWKCGLDTSKAGPAGPADDGGIAGSIPPGCNLIAKIAIDSDFEFYQLNGSSVSATVADI